MWLRLCLLVCGVSAYTSLGGCGALLLSRRASGPECIFRSPFPPPDLPEEHVRQLEEPGSLDSVFELLSAFLEERAFARGDSGLFG